MDIMRVKHLILLMLMLTSFISGEPTCPEKCDCHLLTRHVYGPSHVTPFVINCTSASLYDQPVESLELNATALDLSNNFLTILANDTFDRLHFVEELYLQNNSIVELHSSAFRKLQYLKILDLSRNKISSLHAHIFHWNFKLWDVNLSYNPLVPTYDKLSVMLPSPLFKLKPRGRRSLFDDDCDRRLHIRGCNISHLPEKIYTLLNETVYLDLSFNSIEMLNMSLIRITEDVLKQGLIIRNNTVEMNLICNKHDLITGIDSLDFSGSPLNLTQCQALPQLPTLSELDMSSCNLAEIPNSFFKGAINIVEINLSNNHLKVVDKSLFKELQLLHRVNLENNAIVHIDSDAFLKSHVNKLVLNNNPIALSQDGTFLSSQGFSTLEISSCSLEYLTNTTFQNTSTTRYLDLSYNNIESLSDGIFSHLLQLITLNISHNKIKTIDRHTFFHNNHLNELDLSGNPLTLPINEPFLSAPLLHTLKLNSCNISNLPINTFKNTLQLRKIELSNNSLKYLNVSAFSKLKYLTHLNILDNPLVCEFRLRPLWLHCLEKYINCRAWCASPNGSWNILEDVTPASVTMEPSTPPSQLTESSTVSLLNVTQEPLLPLVQDFGSSTTSSSVVNEVENSSVSSSVIVALVIGLFVGILVGMVIGYILLQKYSKRRSQYEAVGQAAFFNLEEVNLKT